MNKTLVKASIITVVMAISLHANIIPAKEAKKISDVSTQKVLQKFLQNPKTKAAYQEVEKYVGEGIKKVAKASFYNMVHIMIDDISDETRNMKFNKLDQKEKDILKFMLKNELEGLGYKVNERKYNIMGLDWWIAW